MLAALNISVNSCWKITIPETTLTALNISFNSCWKITIPGTTLIALNMNFNSCWKRTIPGTTLTALDISFNSCWKITIPGTTVTALNVNFNSYWKITIPFLYRNCVDCIKHQIIHMHEPHRVRRGATVCPVLINNPSWHRKQTNAISRFVIQIRVNFYGLRREAQSADILYWLTDGRLFPPCEWA